MSMQQVTELPLTLGRQIAAARERMRLDQEELGAALGGYNRTTISRWERDKQVPPFTVVVALSNLSGWPLDYFARADTSDGPTPEGGATQDITQSRCTEHSRLATVVPFPVRAAEHPLSVPA